MERDEDLELVESEKDAFVSKEICFLAVVLTRHG